MIMDNQPLRSCNRLFRLVLTDDMKNGPRVVPGFSTTSCKPSLSANSQIIDVGCVAIVLPRCPHDLWLHRLREPSCPSRRIAPNAEDGTRIVGGTLLVSLLTLWNP